MTDTLLREQEAREAASVTAGIRRYEERRAAGVTLVRSGQDLVAKAQRPMVAQLQADRLKPRRRHRRAIELLADVPAARDRDEPGVDIFALAEITARFILNAAYNERALTPVMESLGRHIGRAVHAHVGDDVYAKTLPTMFKKETERLKRTTSGHFRRKSISGKLRGKEKWSKSIGRDDIAEKLQRAQGPSWSDADYREVGEYLLDVFAKSTRLIHIIEERRPRGKTQYVVKPTERTRRWLEAADDKFSLLKPKYSPMVSEPLEWSVDGDGILDGGYLDHKEARVDFVKGRTALVQDPLNTGGMGDVFDAVNHAQRVPWAINGPVLEVNRPGNSGDSGL